MHDQFAIDVVRHDEERRNRPGRATDDVNERSRRSWAGEQRGRCPQPRWDRRDRRRARIAPPRARSTRRREPKLGRRALRRRHGVAQRALRGFGVSRTFATRDSSARKAHARRTL